MAVVAAPEDVDFIISEAAKENIETSVPARVTDSGRLVMMFNGQKIVDLSRRLMNSNGAPKKAQYFIPELEIPEVEFPHVCGGPAARLAALASDLNICSKRGLSEMFDSSIGADRYSRRTAEIPAHAGTVHGGKTARFGRRNHNLLGYELRL